MSRQLRVGIVGAAGINAANHINAWRKAGALMKFIIDPDDSKGKELAKSLSAEYLPDFRDVRRGDLDAVSISMPPFLHAGACGHFLGIGVHTLCEKPVTLTRAEAETLKKAQEESGAFLMAGFCLRFNPLYIKIKELVRNGEIGRIVTLCSRFSAFGGAMSGWRSDPAKGGGICMVNRIHSIDLARWLLGTRIVSVDAYGGTEFFHQKAEDNCLIILEHENGCLSKIHGHYWRIKSSVVEFEVIGENGRVVIESGGSLTLEREGREAVTVNAGPGNMYEEEFRHFVSCVENNQSPSCGLSDSVAAAEIVEKAVLSMKERRRICLTD